MSTPPDQADPVHAPDRSIHPDAGDAEAPTVGVPVEAGTRAVASMPIGPAGGIMDSVDSSEPGPLAGLAASSLWRTVFERSAIPLSLVSTTGRQLAGNAAYLRFLGYEPDDLDQLDVARTTQEVDRAWTQAYMQRLVAGDLEQYNTEKTYVRKDGTTARAWLQVTPLHHEGRCVALLGALTPIEDRAPVGDGALRKLIENIHDTISLIDGEGRLLETTGRYKPIMGYPKEFWESRSIFDLLVPEDVPKVLELQSEVLARPGETVSSEISVMTAGNKIEILEVHAVNLLDDPDIAGIVITSRNVTEQRAMVQELRASRDDALDEAELRSRMLATVSHELRNPLHAVQGISELLATSALPEAERALAGTINRQVRDLTRVVDDLLASSRLELDSVTLEMDPVDLRSLLDDVVSIAKTVAAPGVEVNALVDTAIPALIRTDPVRLRQVMSNLVGNAVKFTTEGRVRVLAAIEGNDWLVLEVTDSGAGIPPDELTKIFEPFRSASTAGRGAGAGLGLSIVRRIVALLDGTVDVTSTMGVGSAFRIRVPLQIASVQDHLTPALEPSDLASVPNTASDVTEAVPPQPSPIDATVGPPVLVIEDNAVNQQLARAQLKSMGYDCEIAGSGEDGLAYLAAVVGADVEVVLMDFHLPGIDGLETTRRIRELEAALSGDGRHVAIVGVTASASLGDRASCLEAGMDDYVPKPVSLADLTAAFERVGPVRAAMRAARATSRESALAATPMSTSGGSAMFVEPIAAPIVTAATSQLAEPDDPPGQVEAAVDVDALDVLASELGDRSTVVDLIDTFLVELPARIDGIVATGAAGDHDGLHRLVHTLTSSARLLGAASLATVCHEFEHGRLAADVVVDLAAQVRAELGAWASS
jgi:PAS domain S-box-containing protein